MEIKCGTGQRVGVQGSTIAVIGQVKELVKKLTLTLSEKAGVEEYTEYETEAGEKIKANLEEEGSGLENFGPEEAGLESNETLTFEEEVEVR